MTDVVVVDRTNTVTVEPETEEITVQSPDPDIPVYVISGGTVGPPGPVGPQGTQGIQGEQGEQGEPGIPGGAPQSYQHTQGVPSALWTINHNLGFRPNVFIEDTLGRDVVGDISHIDANSLTLTFSAAFSGVAYLS